ncbi:sugar phosphate isomerase/epimerase [Paenibacillus ginsengarvi]|uniref:Sugar phosphate isomerase/epimerase n=2 Tax=Paenibacillus ginsengarvi TaxID=400777 RepID=A0A3B0CM35_9BACL|nr:sugar phosphate isomerase/epimerase [Paenibacillus ginsengarvi]
MWHELNEERWEKYGMGALNGLEISQFSGKAQLEKLQSFCAARGLKYGVHGPILGSRGYKLPRLNSPDPAEWREAMRQVEEETELASRYGADYLLYHYPFFPIFEPPIRKLYAKMPDSSSRYGYGALTRSAFRDISERLFHELGQLQHRYKQRILLEHDFFGDYEDVFIEMFLRHPDIRLVVDTARVDLTHRAFHGFDPYVWLDRLAPSVYLVHYSNLRYEGDTFTHHLPVREAHDEDESCGDAYRYLQYLAQRNSEFHVTFEHNPDLVELRELETIYRRAADACGMAMNP